MSCPICIESLGDARCLTLTCGHSVHLGCMLTAAQYDVRCPVCRQVDTGVTTRQADDDDDDEAEQWMTEIERLSTEYHMQLHTYTARRNRLIRKDMRLRDLRDRAKLAYNEAVRMDNDLTRHWSALQRRMWREDETIVALKRQRTNSMRRWNRLTKQLNTAVEENIGPTPTLLLRTNMLAES